MSNVAVKTKNRTPTSATTSAIQLHSKIYKIPANSSIMMAKTVSWRGFLIYVSLAVSTMLVVYYLPDYCFLESAVAGHSSAILAFIGLQAPVRFVGGVVLVGNYAVARDCTGIQVVAVFAGLILPLRRVSWVKKILSLGLLCLLLYGANLVRVVLEYYLVEAGILPWSLAHYPLSLLLGVVGVFFLVLVNNRIIPEFGEYIYSLVEWFKGSFWRGQRGG